MKQNPFSIYDFLGYLFPGAFGLVVLHFIWYTDNPLCVECFVDSIKVWCSGDNKLEGTLFFILLSYIVGHVIAYGSTWTIESYANWKYGYPSYSLLGIPCSYFERRNNEKWDESEFFSRKNFKCIGSCFFRLLIAVFVFPISILAIVLGEFFFMKKYYIKRFDDYTIRAFQIKLLRLCKKLNLDPIVNIDEKSTDFHRLVTFYEYEYCNKHGSKMDKYVAIYDFMRSLCLIVNTFTLYITWKSVFIWDYDVINYGWVAFFSFATYFLFMSYMKFYRRYTHESFVTLIIDKNL